MRAFIALVALGASIYGAYIHNKRLKNSLLYNTFYLELTKALIHNNQTEMLSFESVFSETYSKIIESSSFSSTEQALNYAKNNLVAANDNDMLIDLLKNYVTSGQAELARCESELLLSCEKALEKSKKQLNEIGKSAYMLYPGLTAIALIILI